MFGYYLVIVSCILVIMTIQKINSKNFKPHELDTAAKILKSGGVIVYPTETCYALGGDFYSEKANKKIYQIKKRRASVLLPVIVANLSMAKKCARFNKKAIDLAQRFWPGPATLILEIKKSSQEKFFAPCHKFLEKYHSIAMRISSNKVARGLSLRFGHPIISTSANISSKDECYCVEDILQQLRLSKIKPNLILDAGILPKVKPSTIIKIIDNKVEILRSGPVKLKYK